MRRVTALVLSILFSISIVLPLVDSSAHRNHRGSAGHHSHRHSRLWWRNYRARLRRQRAALARRRALVAQSGHQISNNLPVADIQRPVPLSEAQMVGNPANDSRGSLNLLLTERKSTTPVTVNGQTQFRLYAQNGQVIGQASLSAVTASPVNAGLMNAKTQRKQLAGVPFTELRRQVIEKMIAGNGWVINDTDREINGRRVFVVAAQTAASSDGRTPARTWNYYFTEIDGRIYSLASQAPLDETEQMSAEAEKVIATLPTSNRSVVAEKAPR